ncbi:hypothetical protein LMG10661_03339 [Ralstonia syzygii subsp. syzygii]|nr:hypothetical protein LMG10661_03339 [Ralstonia syzygii subsp. syzygii]
MIQTAATPINPVLSGFVATPRRVAAVPLIKCRVRVMTENGETSYDGLFPSTCDAVIAAAECLGLRSGKVSARALP